MGFAEVVSKVFRRRRPCPHVGMIEDVTPSSPDSCNACVELGDTWVQLRICLICGNVGCCDNSKNKHATGHFHSSGHAVLQSYQPGEGWRYCFLDDQMLPDGEPFRSR